MDLSTRHGPKIRMEKAMATTTTCPTWCQLHENPDEANANEWTVAHMGILDGVTIERADYLGVDVSADQIPALIRQLTAAGEVLCADR